MAAHRPAISVVTPTHDRAPLLRRLLESLTRQSIPNDRFEVIVVDDASHDDTLATLRNVAPTLPTLRWASSNGGPAVARNVGWNSAASDLILFLDDDVEAAPDLLERHLDAHTSVDELTGVLGRVQWHPDLTFTPFMEWLDRSDLQFAYETWLRPGPIDPPYAAFYTANISLRKELLERIEGFDERFAHAACEDIELAWRLSRIGFRLHYTSDALVYHTRAIDLQAFKRRTAKVASSAMLLARVQPELPFKHAPAGWKVERRIRRRWLALVAQITGNTGHLASYYRAEIAAAYREGLRQERSGT